MQCRCARQWNTHQISSPGTKRNQKRRNRTQTEDDSSDPVAAVQRRQDLRKERPSMRLPKESTRKRMGMAYYSVCGRSHRPRQCRAFGQLHYFARKCLYREAGTHMMVDGCQSEGEDEENVLQIVEQKMERKLMAKMQLEWNGKIFLLECRWTKLAHAMC